jgi:alcohol dehydrogenase class IV
MLPHVLEFNYPACPEKYALLARRLDLPGAEGVATWIREMNAAVGIPARLGEYGVREEMIATMVPKAMEDGCHQNNPRPCTSDDMRALYLAAL